MHVFRLIAIAAACIAVPSLEAGAGDVRFAPMGRIHVGDADVSMFPSVYYPGWIARDPRGGYKPEADGSRHWRIGGKAYSSGGGVTNFTGSTKAVSLQDGSLDVDVRMSVAVTNVQLQCAGLAVRFPCKRYAGGSFVVNGGKVWDLAKVYDKKSGFRVFRGKVNSMAFRDCKGNDALTFEFPEETDCHIQDNREWGGRDDNFSMRVFFPGLSGKTDLKKGDAFALSFKLRTPKPFEFTSGEHVIREGGEWVRLNAKTEMVPGSALDFSRMGFHDAPAGKHGWLVVRDGHFEFEKLPGVRQRFYGVNFVGAANYPPAKDADRYVANLARVGYNAVRFHHHDHGLSKGMDGKLDPEMMERFDAMVAACIKYGIYMTTDLYVSRKVKYRDMGIDKPGFADMREFKTLVETHEGAYQNFLRYSKAFLEHVNPHTGRRYADEPAMPLYSLVNEGNSRESLTVENERNFARRATKWLREEIKTRVLLTNMNNYAYPEEYDDVRANEYDYIDGHFYCDHPHFLETKWRLPSKLPNVNPITRPRHGIYWPLFYRNRIAKAMPFVITEYNYSGPGRYRGVGGIETGAVAAKEGMDGLWRFAWSHGIKGVYGPKAMTYFDMSGDPLSLAGERASLCLFLREDLKTGDKAAIATNNETGGLRIVTDRTCGGFEESGIVDAGALRAKLDGYATVWASTLDGKPFAKSRRLLFCHLTDVQNTEITYADKSCRELLKWGRLPHLMRKGKAEVLLSLGSGDWKVYALDCAGTRRGEVPARFAGGTLGFEADVSRDPADATMLYEIVAQ